MALQRRRRRRCCLSGVLCLLVALGGRRHVPGGEALEPATCPLRAAARPETAVGLTRRSFVTATVASLFVPLAAGAAEFPTEEEKDGEVTSPPPSPSAPPTPVGAVLKNGLRYVDRRVGAGREPQWGDVLQISYVQSVRPTRGAPAQKIDEQTSYLIHHGNGRTVKGLEEGLHTMRVGGARRVEVPASLAYVVGGLGPTPERPWTRRTFDDALDALQDDGIVVFEVELLDAWKDDADLGFWEDNSFSGKDVAFMLERAETIANNLNNKQAAKRASRS